ncbi:acetyl-CoA C-acyltransferase [Kribbella sp. NPDC051952]|uniref:thiolase family protein n=1 Tax=Kribbella sp. NPDC051952 TaxID=3154851 RepID=UPI00342BF29A
MNTAVLIDAVRTAGGKRYGGLSGWHPADLAGEVLSELMSRNGVDPELVDDVVMGCVTQVGRQAANIGRYAALAAGFPESVPATTIDRQCGSSQQAVHFAAQGVQSGAYDVVVAAGVEVMSSTPMASAIVPGLLPYGDKVVARYEPRGGLQSQGIAAELITSHWKLNRELLDEYGVRSQRLATIARDEGRFDREIVPLRRRTMDRETGEIVEGTELVRADEGIRPDTNLEVLATLKPSFVPEGRTTAATSSQITDGASAALIMSEQKARELGLTPRARFHTFSVTGSDPVMMLTGPIPATRKVLAKAGLEVSQIDHFEVNEAFAAVVLAWIKELRPQEEKVNPNGGAIALGHPLGGSGVKLLATMLHELERTGGRFGLQTMCEGGGLANAMIVERLG